MAISTGAAILGAAVASGLLGARSAGKAADAQRQASDATVAEQRRQFDLIRGDTQPYRDVGQNALFQLASLYGLYDPSMQQAPEGGQTAEPPQNELTQFGAPSPDMGYDTQKWWTSALGGDPDQSVLPVSNILAQYQSQFADPNQTAQAGAQPGTANGQFQPMGMAGFQASPGYNFRLGEGIRALDRSAASRGRLFSGAQGRALTRYGQGVASNEFGNYFNRLASLAGTGQTGVAQSGQAGMQAAGNIGNALMAGGQGQANAAMARGSAFNNAIQGGISNYLTYQGLNQPQSSWRNPDTGSLWRY